MVNALTYRHDMISPKDRRREVAKYSALHNAHSTTSAFLMLCWCGLLLLDAGCIGALPRRRSPKPPAAGCVRAKGGGVSAAEKEEDVDCLTAKKRVKKCDAECLLGATAPQTLKGHEVCVPSGVDSVNVAYHT